MAETLLSEDYSNVKRLYDNSCGKHHSDKDKTWIIDIDELGYDSTEMEEYIDGLQPLDTYKIVSKIPSLNGYHIITRPFNLQEFKNKYDADVHKDNPTNLFIP